MAASGGAGKAAQTVQDLLASPYVRRAMEDPAVRDNAKVAYQSAREALDRVKGSDNVVNALFDDRKLQAQLASTGRGIAGAREHLHRAAARSKRHIGRAILVVVVGAALALALSEGLRNKVLDVLFGAEEEFDYVSTTAPPEPAPSPVAEAPAPVEDVAEEGRGGRRRRRGARGRTPASPDGPADHVSCEGRPRAPFAVRAAGVSIGPADGGLRHAAPDRGREGPADRRRDAVVRRPPRRVRLDVRPRRARGRRLPRAAPLLLRDEGADARRGRAPRRRAAPAAAAREPRARAERRRDRRRARRLAAAHRP